MKSVYKSLLFISFSFHATFQRISRKALNTAPPVALPPASKDLAVLKDTVNVLTGLHPHGSHPESRGHGILCCH